MPLSLQAPAFTDNLKYRAILSHASQWSGRPFLLNFMHKDEIFWSENPFGGNRPPVAEAGPSLYVKPGDSVQLDGTASRDPEGTPLAYQWTQRSGSAVTLNDATGAQPWFFVPGNASSDDNWAFQLNVSDGSFGSAPDMVQVFAGARSRNIAADATITASSQDSSAGQLAIKAADRAIDGYPLDGTREWATVQQGVGAWLRLNWATPQTVEKVVLFDRINSADRVTAGTLSFSDGTTVPVGTLPNNGDGLAVAFSPRAVTEVRFTVTSVSSTTLNVGLAEVQVIGRDAGPNLPPVLANPGPQSGTVGVPIAPLQLVATDGDNDGLAFSVSGLPSGLAISAGGLVTGTPSAAGTSSVTVTVSDGHGGSDSKTFSWTITTRAVRRISRQL